MIYYLIYSSTMSLNCTEQELENILAVSRKNNVQKNITGILAYYKGNFIQLIEGEQEVIRNLYNTISNDFRHCFIEKILEGYASEKQFPNWSMAFKHLSPEEYREFNGKIPLDINVITHHVISGEKKHSPILAALKRFISN